MEKRRISSLEVSAIGLGCNNFGWKINEAASHDVVHAALDAGVTFFDTSDSYGDTQSEVFLGRALDSRRKDVVVATKFGSRLGDARKGAHPGYIQRAVEDSLRRLGTDYIDLYQLHFPDPETPIADTLGALDALVKAGKVREIGCSNFTAAMLVEAKDAVAPGAARFASVQNELNLIKRSDLDEAMPEAERQQMAYLPYFPLASGLLTGKYRAGKPLPSGTRISADDPYFGSLLESKNLAVVEKLIAFAESSGRSVLQLAFAWLLAHPSVASVIAGATSSVQVKSNAQAANWTLSAAELESVAALLA